MNIALVIESLEGGGAEHIVHRLALGIAGRGARVFVYCLKAAGVAATRVPGVTLRQAHSTGREPLLCRRIADWLRRDRITVAHAHSCAALVHTFPATSFLRMPLTHVWHGWPLGPPTRHHRLAVQLDRWSAGVGVNSRSLCERLPEHLARRAVYLPNGIDLPPRSSIHARRRLEALCACPFAGPVILTVANVRVEKDLGTLLVAFARLRAGHPDAHLVCIGAVRDTANWALLQRMVGSLSLGPHVHFAGPSRNAWELMSGADIFCLSSRTESMPNVILEAMTQRVPIVATAVGDVGTLAAAPHTDRWLLRQNETALLVPPGAPDELAVALDAVVRDPTAARRRAVRAFDDYRARFTTDQMVQRYLQFYEGAARLARPPQRIAVRPGRPRVLMLGPAAPQIGGMVTSIDTLMTSPLRRRFALYRRATPPPRGSSRNVIRRLARQLAALFGTATTLVVRRVDLLHIHTCSYLTFYRSLLDLAVAKALGCRVVIHIRGGQFENFARHVGRTAQCVIRLGLASADAVIVVSERWRPVVRRYAGSTPVCVVPNAVASVAPASGRRNGHPCRFLYLGKLARAKGVSELIDAAKELRASGVPFELLLAGPADDGEQARWQQSIQAAGLAPLTTLMGPVRGDDKWQLLRSADCFVHPSHSEALPNAVLEAAAAGLPVIATAVGSLPEALTRAAETQPLCPLVPPHDTAALARAMQRLACDSSARRRIGTTLHQHVAALYSPARVAEQLASVYEQVLKRARS